MISVSRQKPVGFGEQLAGIGGVQINGPLVPDVVGALECLAAHSDFQRGKGSPDGVHQIPARHKMLGHGDGQRHQIGSLLPDAL